MDISEESDGSDPGEQPMDLVVSSDDKVRNRTQTTSLRKQK